MKLESLLSFYRRQAIYVVHRVHFQTSLVRADFQQKGELEFQRTVDLQQAIETFLK